MSLVVPVITSKEENVIIANVMLKSITDQNLKITEGDRFIVKNAVTNVRTDNEPPSSVGAVVKTQNKLMKSIKEINTSTTLTEIEKNSAIGEVFKGGMTVPNMEKMQKQITSSAPAQLLKIIEEKKKKNIETRAKKLEEKKEFVIKQEGGTTKKKIDIKKVFSGENMFIVLAVLLIVIIITIGIILVILGTILAIALMIKNNPDVTGFPKVYLIMTAMSLNWFYVIYSIAYYNLFKRKKVE